MEYKNVQLIFQEKLQEIRSRVPVPFGDTTPFEKTLVKQTNASTPNASVQITGSNTFDSFIQKAALHYDVDISLIKAVIDAESSFNPKSVSSKGAMGLMQLMPGTAEGLGVADPMDPYQNIMGGVKFLKSLLDRYDGDETLALAAYNAGPGRVKQYGGVPPFKETQSYVRKVLEKRKIYQQE